VAGLSPIGGIVDPLPVGRVQVEHSWNKIIGTLTVKAAPLFDSVLAMSGLRDPTTGRTWGRAVEIGPEAGVVYLFTDTLAGSVSAAASSVRGHNVQANGHITFNASLNYTFKPTGFDFIRVGPTYGFQHYSRNENFFTLGHGGYYSPDRIHSLGAFVEFQTDEAKRWQLAGRVSGGWTHKVEASAPQFPLADNGAVFLGARGSEFTTDSVLRGTVMLGDHLRLGMMGRYTQAPSGRDYAGAVTLSIPFGGRSATFSTELPRVLDRSWP
jgi:hypothetical protein